MHSCSNITPSIESAQQYRQAIKTTTQLKSITLHATTFGTQTVIDTSVKTYEWKALQHNPLRACFTLLG